MKLNNILKKAGSLILTFAMVASLTVVGAAAETTTKITDSHGNKYTLSQPIKDSYIEKNCPYGGESEYTVYVVEYGTQITCPSGMIFTGGLFNLEDQNHWWTEAHMKDGYFYAGVSTRKIRNEEELIKCMKGTNQTRESDSLPLNPPAHIHIKVASSFQDVPYDSYYSAPVLWAMCEKITQGTSETEFSPNNTCTRAQIITFLWRENHSPKIKNITNPFTDVQPDAYYYDACLWAYSNDIIDGGAFYPNAGCTRAMAVEFLWRQGGCTKVKDAAAFEDVPTTADWAPAVAWAVKKGITAGTTEKTFSPDAICTRAQIVTFMYRNLDSKISPDDIIYEPFDIITPVGPATLGTAEEVMKTLPEEEQKALKEVGATTLTTADSVNNAIGAGKNNAFPTFGYTETANINGYHTEATIDVSGAVLDYDVLAILNKYREDWFNGIYKKYGNDKRYDTADNLTWTTGDVAEECILACAKYPEAAKAMWAITIQANSKEELIKALTVTPYPETGYPLARTMAGRTETNVIAAYYTNKNGNTTYAFLYNSEGTDFCSYMLDNGYAKHNYMSSIIE